MKQKFTVLFDLDGTLVDTAPDLMLAHNHVMRKFGYPTKSLDELKSAVGQGAGAMIGRSIWSQAKKELTSINEKIKNEMTDEFISYYGKNILNESTLMPGVKDFLNWCKNENISIFIGKEKSPSCGIQQTSAYINGCECKCNAPGLTSKILKENGIELISEWELK
jgi:phosphoglycolate phosphatase